MADIAERMQCPPDFIMVGGLAALGAVVGRKLGIRPKRHDDWLEIPNLWGLCVGNPGVLKTPALNEALRPLRMLSDTARKNYQDEIKKYEAELEIAEIRKKGLKEEINKALKQGKTVDEFRERLASMQPAKPVERRYTVNDATVEKLGELLNQNPNGLLYYRDELSGLLALMDRQGHENDRAFFLECWNGQGSYTYDRVERGTLHIESACLSILGNIQPGPLETCLREVFDGHANDGFIQRFQLAVYPDTSFPWTNIDRQPDYDARRVVEEIFKNLDDLKPETVGAKTDEGIPFLHFDDAAQELFDDWRAGLERKIRSNDDEHPVLISHLQKYPSLVSSLALLFHLVNCVTEGSTGPVSETAVRQAIALSEYFEKHARRIYQTVTGGSQTTAALLAKKLLSGKLKNLFTTRQVYNNGWTGLSDTQNVERALEALEEAGWVRAEDNPPKANGGRRSRHFHINSRLSELNADLANKSPSVPAVTKSAIERAVGNQPAKPAKLLVWSHGDYSHGSMAEFLSEILPEMPAGPLMKVWLAAMAAGGTNGEWPPASCLSN